MSSAFSFSAVIISYNGKELLGRSLRALQKSSAVPEKIIVVDDCSSDGTSDMVSQDFPSIAFIRNEKNLGPAASRNRGAREVMSRYIVFLDNDILIRSDSIGNLLAFLAAHPEAGLAGGKLISELGVPIRWNMGHRPSFFRDVIGSALGFFVAQKIITTPGFMNFVMRFSYNHWPCDRTIAVGWVIESFHAILRDVFERIKGFDENFFMFFEGPDLSERLRQQHLKTYFVCDAVVDMLEGHTHSPFKRRRLFYSSMLRYYFKHH